MAMITSYSPNIRWGKQHVEITLMQWGYSGKFTVDVGGTCHGLSVMDCAIGILYERFLPLEPALDGEDEPAKVILHKPNGHALHCSDDEGLEDEWVRNMVVFIQITGWTPPTLNQVRKMNGAKPVKGGNKPWVPDLESTATTESLRSPAQSKPQT